MAKFIKEIHDAVSFAAGKNVSSKYPPSKVDAVVYEVMLDEFNDLYEEYAKTTKTSRDLDPFKDASEITVNNGIAVLDSDIVYPRYVALTDGTLVHEIHDGFWTNAVSDPVDPPSLKNPLYIIEAVADGSGSKKIKVEPKTGIDKIVFYYFRLPKAPKYAFDIVSDKYVYNDAESVDIEFNRFRYKHIVDKVLSRLGINLRDRDLVQYSEIQKRENQ